MSESSTTEFVVTKLKCSHCLHEWVPRFDRKPLVCPRCKRYRWDEPHKKSRKSKGGARNVRKKQPSAIEKFVTEHKTK